MTAPNQFPPAQPAPMRWLWAIAGGFFAFLGAWAAGLVVTFLLIRHFPLEVPHPTEAYEGIGDALMIEVLFRFGIIASFLLAMVVGFLVASFMAYRLLARRID